MWVDFGIHWCVWSINLRTYSRKRRNSPNFITMMLTNLSAMKFDLELLLNIFEPNNEDSRFNDMGRWFDLNINQREVKGTIPTSIWGSRDDFNLNEKEFFGNLETTLYFDRVNMLFISVYDFPIWWASIIGNQGYLIWNLRYCSSTAPF